MAKIEDLALKLEQSYENMLLLMDDIGKLKQVFEAIQKATDDFKSQYETVMDKSKFEEIKKANQNAVTHILGDIKKIEESLTIVEVYKQHTEESINQFTKRIGNLEESFKKTKQAVNDVDVKLTTLVKNVEKTAFGADQKIIKASKLFDISAEIEHYDELLKLQRDNNRMLRELTNKAKGPIASPDPKNRRPQLETIKNTVKGTKI